MTETGRFPIRIDHRFSWLFALLGLQASSCYITIDEDVIRFRMGIWFDQRVALRDTIRAELDRVPIELGLGIHADYRGNLALNGSRDAIVRVDLARPRRMRLIGFITAPVSHVYVSLGDPDGFVESVRSAKGK